MIKLKNILLENNLDTSWIRDTELEKQLQSITDNNDKSTIIRAVWFKSKAITNFENLITKHLNNDDNENINFLKKHELLNNILLIEFKLKYRKKISDVSREKRKEINRIIEENAFKTGFDKIGKFRQNPIVFVNTNTLSGTDIRGNVKISRFIFISVTDKKDKNDNKIIDAPISGETTQSSFGIDLSTITKRLFLWNSASKFIEKYRVISKTPVTDKPITIQVPNPNLKIVFGYDGSEPATNIKIRNIKALLKLPHSSNDPMHFDNELKGYLQQYQAENGLTVNGEWNLETAQFVAANPEISIKNTNKADERGKALDAGEDAEEAVTRDQEWTLTVSVDYDTGFGVATVDAPLTHTKAEWVSGMGFDFDEIKEFFVEEADVESFECTANCS